MADLDGARPGSYPQIAGPPELDRLKGDHQEHEASAGSSDVRRR